MTTQTKEELLAAQLEQQKIDLDEPVVEDDDEEDDDDDEDDEDDDEEQVGDVSGMLNQSRSERKVKAAMLKLGMKPISGITRVTMKMSKELLSFSRPEVYKSPNSDTYIICGKFQASDLRTQLSAVAAEKLKTQGLSQLLKPAVIMDYDDDDDDDDDEDDEAGVEPKDVELVMTQAMVSRAKAVRALKANDGDIVAAIMELTNC